MWRGDGEGCHLNVVLRPGDDEAQILMRFNEMVTAIQIFGAEALVVSLGFDMGSDDPLSEVGMTATGFAEMARRIAAMDLPTAYIQEGGYLGPSLTDNAQAFFRRRHLTIRWPLCSSDLILQRANPERRRFSGARPYVRV